MHPQDSADGQSGGHGVIRWSYSNKQGQAEPWRLTIRKNVPTVYRFAMWSTWETYWAFIVNMPNITKGRVEGFRILLIYSSSSELVAFYPHAKFPVSGSSPPKYVAISSLDSSSSVCLFLCFCWGCWGVLSFPCASSDSGTYIVDLDVSFFFWTGVVVALLGVAEQGSRSE